MPLLTQLSLFLENRPGRLKIPCQVLGKAGINIARMQVGLHPTSGRATSLWNLDSALPEAVMGEIKKLPNVASALCLALP